MFDPHHTNAPQCQCYQRLDDGSGTNRLQVRQAKESPAPPRYTRPAGKRVPLPLQKTRPEWSGGLILSNRKMSRASGCNRAVFFPAVTGTNRKLSSQVPVSAKIFRALRDGDENFFPAGFCKEDYPESGLPIPGSFREGSPENPLRSPQ
jgi:hypothetical protein